MNAEKPLNNPHKVNLATLGEETTEKPFNVGVFREVNEVIDVQPER
jgi:hypothetical protein